MSTLRRSVAFATQLTVPVPKNRRVSPTYFSITPAMADKFTAKVRITPESELPMAIPLLRDPD